MEVNGKPQRSIWVDEETSGHVQVIDQRHLPHEFVVENLKTLQDAAKAIREMHVRGAPLIGVTAAFGMYLASASFEKKDDYDARLLAAAQVLRETRPTAVNLFWAIEQQLKVLSHSTSGPERTAWLRENAIRLADEDAATCRRIGEHGLEMLEKLYAEKQEPLNILTHCNAGWLATVDYGTATAPMYLAHDKGIPLHIWVDETRPRNQGARLTAWELGQHGIPHTVIPDNTGGHLMQHGMVDLCIVGSDRTTRTGDVANKIGTYLKALAAHDNDVPFYVALPGSTFDWSLYDGLKEIPIETRSPDEVRLIQGKYRGELRSVLLTPENSPAINYGFDVTPSRLVTGLITERGICDASERGIAGLYPEFAPIA